MLEGEGALPRFDVRASIVFQRRFTGAGRVEKNQYFAHPTD
jgi:hypothetical protein